MPTQHDEYSQRFPDGLQREQLLSEASYPPEREYQGWEFLSREHDQMARHEWYRRRIRESIGSPVMREVVAEAHRLTEKVVGVPWKRSDEDYLKHVEGTTADALKYRDWVREMLRKSDLAQRIPGGREALPDIYEAMGEPWRSIEKLREPRSYEQLVQHLVKHLDWYLDHTQPVKPPLRLVQWLSFALSLVVCAGVFFAATKLLPAIARFDFAWFFGFNLMYGGLFYVATRIWGQQKTVEGSVVSLHPIRNYVHAAELYYYLIDAWVDPTDLEPPTSDRSAEFDDLGALS